MLLIIDQDDVPAKVVGDIAKIAGRGLASVRAGLKNHEPVLDVEIFPRDDPDMPKKLHSLLQTLGMQGMSFRAYELLKNQTYDPKQKYFGLDDGKIEAMMVARNQSLAQQSAIAYLEDGEE